VTQAKHEWWKMSIAETAVAVESDPESGLGSAEAAVRLERDGRNELAEAPPRSPTP
jgi:Ca2+-transporting ATPase